MPTELLKKTFNMSLYENLCSEDRSMIDEYSQKMGADEINSFMIRLLEYDRADILETEEESISPAKDLIDWSIANSKRIDGIETIEVVPEKIMHSINKYFSGARLKNKYNEWLYDAIKVYFSSNGDLNIARPMGAMKNEIYEVFLGHMLNNKKYIRKIDNIKLPIVLYTYRTDRKTKRRNRLGIAIDKFALPATKSSSAGYGRNFKVDLRSVDIKLNINNKKIDLSKFISGIGYWSPGNAALHGFDDRTGIIWFTGTQVGDNMWRFPDGIIIKCGAYAIINAIIGSDALSKMLQRSNINKRIQDAIFF